VKRRGEERNRLKSAVHRLKSAVHEQRGSAGCPRVEKGTNEGNVPGSESMRAI